MSAYLSFGAQALHYFDRPHDGLPPGPVVSQADWRGAQFTDSPQSWLIHLSAEEVDEIGTAIDEATNAGIRMSELTAQSVPMPGISAKARSWREEIASGRGFVVVRGFPVDDWGTDKSAAAFWAIGHQLGAPGAQNPQNELLGHVVDYGEEKDNPSVRRYRTAGNIDFHCDAADVVGLLCLQTAKSGGQSRIASSVAIFNALLEREGERALRLFEPVPLDLRGEHPPDQPGYAMIAPCRYNGGVLRTFFHSDYFHSAARHFDPPKLEADWQALLDAYDALAASPEFRFDMWLEKGDMQFLSNHAVIHARTEYEDWPEPGRKRHLLRLWLSLHAEK